MKQLLPTVIAFLAGFLMIADFFFKSEFIQSLSKDLQGWTVIVSAFALGLGAVSLVRVHARNIARRAPGWINGVVLLASMFFMIVTGITMGTKNAAYLFAYDNMLSPLGAAVYASIAFHITSASFRAFRARNVEAAILLASALIVLLGRAPIGETLAGFLPSWADWIVNVPNVGAQRGIIICAALGVMGSSLRVLLGIERRYLGS